MMLMLVGLRSEFFLVKIIHTVAGHIDDPE